MSASRLAVRAAGAPRRGVAVLLHGLGESSLGFAHLLAAPAFEGWQLLAIDLPGYGRSISTEEPHRGLAHHAETLVEWLAGLGRPPVLIAHSMGAVVALLAAERAPERIRAILDIEGNVAAGDCRYSGHIARIPERQWVPDGLARLRDTVWERGVRDPAHRTYFASLSFADPWVLRRDALDLVELSASGDLAARRARLAMPLHYLAGSPGGADRDSQAALSAAGVEWATIAESGHWPFIDQTEQFLERAREFLDRV